MCVAFLEGCASEGRGVYVSLLTNCLQISTLSIWAAMCRGVYEPNPLALELLLLSFRSSWAKKKIISGISSRALSKADNRAHSLDFLFIVVRCSRVQLDILLAMQFDFGRGNERCTDGRQAKSSQHFKLQFPLFVFSKWRLFHCSPAWRHFTT